MSKRYLKSLIAIAVLVALWFAFTGWNRHKSHAQSSKPVVSAKVLPVSASQIESFTITPNTGRGFSAVREGKTWAITEPQPVSADPAKVSSFLQSLTSATEDQQIASRPADLKDFGLDPPAETLDVTTDTHPRHFALALGEETPTSSGVYAKVAGHSQVFTLTDDLKTSLEKKLFDLRDTRAVTLNTDQINRIDVQNGAQSYTLAKNPEGVWEVSLPENVRADHFTVEGLVDSLQSMTMQSVVSEDKKNDTQYGFAKPTLSVKLSAPGGNQSLIFGKKASQGYYAVNSALAPVFTLGEDSLSQFQKTASDLRDKNLFSWDMFDVKSFEVTTPKGHWAFEQNKNQWKEAAPAAKPASSDDVSAFLSALRGLEAASFPAAKPGALAPFGLNKPSYVFKVSFGASHQTEEVDVAQANGHVYARRASDPLPSEVDSSAFTTVQNTFQKIAK
ncbi:MAG: DUF4340 domain-containing protein [Terriglobia bacterium]